jgi:RND family efflux transporter MFP subunit
MKSVFLSGAACLALTLAACNRESSIQAKQDAGPIQIRTATVQARQIHRTVESVGTMFPFDETIVSAEIDGPIAEVKVDLGDFVKQGQLMVRISDEEQRYLLSQTEAQLRQSMERLGLTNEQDRLKDVREAPEVRRARADFFDAEQRYNRVRQLVEQGIASQADLDQASARFKAMQAAYDTELNTARHLVQEVEKYRAALDLQRKKLRDTNVLAPFSAYVKDRQATLGQYVRVNTPLVTLVKTDPIRLRLEMPERMAPWVRNGQMVDVLVEAFENRTFRGKIWRISPTVDQSKRTFVAEALIENSRGELKPGSYAKARVPTDKVERVRIVPTRAVNYVLGSNKAYVVNGDTIEARELKLGDRYEQSVEVVEGLEEGERVATTQLARLDTGVKVRVVEGAEGSKSEQKTSD